MNIIVIGEKCLDRFIYCVSKRLCPEAPVPVLNPLEIIENEGMSGNVVRNIKALSKKDIDIIHWHQSENFIKTRYVDKRSNQMFIRFDEGEDNHINYLQLNEVNLTMLKKADIVIVSDYHKGYISNEMLIQIGKNAKLSILDSKRVLTKEIIQSYTFVKLNELELEINKNIDNMNNILITLGARGTEYKGIIYPSPNPQETIDVSGAGDTFTSAFILKYFETYNTELAIIYANEKASHVVSKRGVSIPN